MCGSGRCVLLPARPSTSISTIIPISLSRSDGGANEIETIFGDKIMVQEPPGSTVFINEMRPVHRLTNRSSMTYLSRLVELKHLTWAADE